GASAGIGAPRRPAASGRGRNPDGCRSRRDHRFRGIAWRRQWSADNRQGNRAAGDLRAGRLRATQRDSWCPGARDAGGIAAAVRPLNGSHGHRCAGDFGRSQPERALRADAVEDAPGRGAGAGMIMALAPGTRGYTKGIVAAQMLAQIGAFALPALLPDYIVRWDLSKTEAGWLVGIFFAAYVV